MHKIRLLPDGTEIPFEANPKNAPECIACPNALQSADATSTECCNDCLSLRRKFVASGLDVDMAAREAQCREGCRIEMYTDVLPVSGYDFFCSAKPICFLDLHSTLKLFH